MKKGVGGWTILLIFPAIGLVGMLLIITDTLGNDLAMTPTSRRFPTPIPLDITRYPTVPPPTSVMDLPAPEVTLTDLAGQPLRFSDWRGQIVIINFWATWCAPCVEEMPLLQQYAAAHPEVVILAITDPEDGQTVEGVRDFVEDYALSDVQIALERRSGAKGAFGAVNLPMTFVLDQAGIIRFRQIGAVTAEDLDQYVAALQP